MATLFDRDDCQDMACRPWRTVSGHEVGAVGQAQVTTVGAVTCSVDFEGSIVYATAIDEGLSWHAGYYPWERA